MGLGPRIPVFHQPKVGIAERQNQTVSHPHLRCDSRCLNQERTENSPSNSQQCGKLLDLHRIDSSIEIDDCHKHSSREKKVYRMSINQKPSKNHQKPSTTDPIFPSPRYDSAFWLLQLPVGHGRNGSRHGVLSWHRIRWDFPQGFPIESPTVWCRKVALLNLPCFCHVPYIRFKNHDVDPIVLSERPQNTDDFFWAKVMLVISRPVFWRCGPKNHIIGFSWVQGFSKHLLAPKCLLKLLSIFWMMNSVPPLPGATPSRGISRLERAANVAAKMTGFHGPPWQDTAGSGYGPWWPNEFLSRSKTRRPWTGGFGGP